MNVINQALDNNSIELLLGDTVALLEILTSLSTVLLELSTTAQYLTTTSGVTQSSINSILEKINNVDSLFDLTTYALAGKLDFALDVFEATGLPLNLLVATLLNLSSQNSNGDSGKSDHQPNSLCIPTDKVKQRQKKWEKRQLKWNNKR